MKSLKRAGINANMMQIATAPKGRGIHEIQDVHKVWLGDFN